MQHHLTVILAAIGAATAQSFTNSTTAGGSPTSGSMMPSPTGADDKAFPSKVGDFSFFGCLTGEFPGFSKVATDEKMSLDLCAASCPSAFMGVIGKDCFCGTAVDSNKSKKDDKSKCNLACPGNPVQHCGGSPKGMKRADVPAGSAMTAYQRDASASSSVVTSTRVHTITSCAPTVTDCPVGSVTTQVVVQTVEVCPTPQWHKKKIVCYGDYCAPEYQCKGSDCKTQRVVCEGDKCTVEDHSGKDWHKLVICKDQQCRFSQCQGAECDKKIVCYGGNCVVEKCYGNECEKNMVCTGDQCGWEKCTGDQCKTVIVCDNNGNCNQPKGTNSQGVAPPTGTHGKPTGPAQTNPPVMAGGAKAGVSLLAALGFIALA
ncbi:hypothetical protein NLG97_g8240 [Lecanicillium saksenae]|uniref:Uncharacterized protein n=1 Tax=Lecanicillium saksenae TaxID=468837 RepID=A0ACC1QNB9_9HYPO|nr:hypothetical protein NLG97_g8240 [Lecanicillium saksenae]